MSQDSLRLKIITFQKAICTKKEGPFTSHLVYDFGENLVYFDVLINLSELSSESNIEYCDLPPLMQKKALDRLAIPI
jgi:hypothetical protein